MIRVHIAASTPVARAGLEAVLRAQAEFEVVTQDAGADVVIADVLPNDAVQYAPAAIVLLADDSAPAWSAELLRGGVRAVLAHGATPGPLRAAGIWPAAAGVRGCVSERPRRAPPAPRRAAH